MTVSAQAEPLENIITSRTLQRLGSDLYDVIKYRLRHRYHIRLDEGSKEPIDLVELGNALLDLIGNRAAHMLMQDIYYELAEQRQRENYR